MRAHSNRKILLLFVEQNGKCYYCKDDLIHDCINNKSPQIDHIIPKKESINNCINNLCLTCSYCNTAKGKKSESDFLKYIEPYLLNKCEKRNLRKYNLMLNLNNNFIN
jgi:CRISPR/Cas system Type II protein with McrA/HNH and RuvC-like nuclease domain